MFSTPQKRDRVKAQASFLLGFVQLFLGSFKPREGEHVMDGQPKLLDACFLG